MAFWSNTKIKEKISEILPEIEDRKFINADINIKENERFQPSSL